MRIAPTVTVAFVGFLIVMLAGSAGGAAASGAGAQSIDGCAVESPDDFGVPVDGDAIGYVDGYWYDEPIVLDGANASTANDSTNGDSTATEPSESPASNGTRLNATDGLSDRELSTVVARTAARVEAVRCRSFTEVPTVRVENRSTVRAEDRAALLNRSAALRRYDDARLATALLLGDRTNATRARLETTSAATLGYYDPATDEIVVVSENASAARVDEPTLAHELVHALQDQLFDLGRFDANRTDAALAESGLIEGDASLVEYRYRQRCQAGSWGPDCLDASAGTTDDGDYYGLELFFFQPYNSGPRYVETLYEDGGWAAVDARFEDPPSSSRATIAPGEHATAPLANVSFDAAVTDPRWSRLAPPGEPRADRLGPGTIGAAMLAPTFEPETDPIYGAQRVTNNVDQSTLDPLNPYDYGIDATTGWAGDRLEIYQTVDGETATRWRTVWHSEEAATTFRERYVELLELRDARLSRNFLDTYHFPPDSSYSGRFSVRQDGSAVVVAHGPTLEALRALDPDAAPEPPNGYSPPAPGLDGSTETAEDTLYGPGALGVLLAVCVVAILLVAVRQR